MRFIINTPEELITRIEELAQNSRESIGKTRTKLESNELKGQVYAYNEVIFYIKEFMKTQNEKSSVAVGSVSMDTVSDISADSSLRSAETTAKVAKPA